MQIGKTRIMGEFKAGCMVKCFSAVLTSACTSVTISGLNGDVDEEYELIVKVVSGANSNAISVTCNSDTGANYGSQLLYGSNASTGASRDAARAYLEFLNWTHATGDISWGRLFLHAKSGFARTGIIFEADRISSTTVVAVSQYGVSWNNTADNLTQLVVTAAQANGLAIGTSIELYKKVTVA